MLFTFKLENYLDTTSINIAEDVGFKSVYFYMSTFKDNWPSCTIYCNEELLFILKTHGNRTYLSRYYKSKEVLSTTLVDGKLGGFAFLYKDEMMGHILHYNHHNLDGDQLCLKTGYSVKAKHGKLLNDIRSTAKGNNDILFAHELVLALIKWM